MPPSRLLGPAAVALLGCILLARVADAGADAGMGPGEIRGQLFTADHPESTASHAEVFLVYRDAAGERRELGLTTGGDGRYDFTGLSIDAAQSYVVRVDFRGSSFLGAPMQFADERVLTSNFLVSLTAPPITAPRADGEGRPGSAEPQAGTLGLGEPVPPRPELMLLWTAAVAAGFAWPILAARRRDAERRARGPAAPPENSLVRDIAALDLRFEEGALERGDYERVRASLLARLRAERSEPNAMRTGSRGPST